MNRTTKWRPSASIVNLYKRASIISKIRNFFSARNVLEVETPTISKATVTDVNLVPFKTSFSKLDIINDKQNELWLITSPEYHMKRLLAAGSGPIYQICHCFRNEEHGRYHNPEFTMLEWYRPDYDLFLLMHEVNDLLKQILEYESAEFISYQDVFMKYLNIDPLSINQRQLEKTVKKLSEDKFVGLEQERDTLLQVLFMIGIEKLIGIHNPIFIYHFPASQAALAKISTKDTRVSERFEVYYKGIELANGFQELTDRHEQSQRFKNDCLNRSKRGLPQYPIDMNFLNALVYGMPDCSGVAIGVDRLVMLSLKAMSLSEVMAFDIDRC